MAVHAIGKRGLERVSIPQTRAPAGELQGSETLTLLQPKSLDGWPSTPCPGCYCWVTSVTTRWPGEHAWCIREPRRG
jgi:hypothetical protein